MTAQLHDKTILIVEDAFLIGMDVAQAFNKAGAQVTLCTTLAQAFAALQDDKISAAILDHLIGNQNSADLCAELDRRGIPYVMYSGLPEVDYPCHKALLVPKPATHAELIAAVAKVVRG